MNRTDRHFNVVVAALTRKRPEMLRSLLLSWAKMAIPERCSVKCLVVENDSHARSRSVVDECRPLFQDCELLYVLEPELGIPFGRNRAAREAIAAGADLLLFVDDDEVVAIDWLVRMVAGYRNSNAVLLGAPLRTSPPAEPVNYLQRMMYRNVENRYRHKEERASASATLNTTGRVTIVTNNWLGEVSIFRDHNIWFDEEMRFTGGTDSKLFAVVRAVGLPTGWVNDAFVYETIPPERLSFLYQHRRARDQANTHIRRKAGGASHAFFVALLPIPVKLLVLAALLGIAPFTGGRTLLAIARTSGWISGRIGFVLGHKSALYDEVTGC